MRGKRRAATLTLPSPIKGEGFFYRILICLLAAFFLWGCRGDIPRQHTSLESLDFGAILIKGRLVLPSGKARGELSLNFESDTQRYRLTVQSKETTLYEVQPGTYHLVSARTMFGSETERLLLEINGRTINLSFPPEIAQHAPIVVRPGEVIPIGIVQIKFTPSEDRNKASVTTSLEDNLQAQGEMFREITQRMMGPDISDSERDALMIWAQPMQRALIQNQKKAGTEIH